MRIMIIFTAVIQGRYDSILILLSSTQTLANNPFLRYDIVKTKITIKRQLLIEFRANLAENI